MEKAIQTVRENPVLSKPEKRKGVISSLSVFKTIIVSIHSRVIPGDSSRNKNIDAGSCNNIILIKVLKNMRPDRYMKYIYYLVTISILIALALDMAGVTALTGLRLIAFGLVVILSLAPIAQTIKFFGFEFRRHEKENDR